MVSIKILEKNNVRINLCALGNDFLNMTRKVKMTKEKK